MKLDDCAPLQGHCARCGALGMFRFTAPCTTCCDALEQWAEQQRVEIERKRQERLAVEAEQRWLEEEELRRTMKIASTFPELPGRLTNVEPKDRYL